MYAVIEQGGKQHTVAEGDRLNIELVDVDPKATQIELDKVLFVGDSANSRLGTPCVDGRRSSRLSTVRPEASGQGREAYVTYFRRA